MKGPGVYFYLFGNEQMPITETIVNSWIVMLVIFIVCKVLTHNLQKVPKGKQVIAEMAVKSLDNLVDQAMGPGHLNFAPYIGALFAFSVVGSLSSLFGFRPLTADLNTTLGWALMTFFMVQYNNIKCNGFGGYLKGFAEPIPVMVPMNIISEVANPISMSFRHFGNIAAGMVITSLLYDALAALSNFVLGGITSIPILQIGIPGILSLYFDVFTAGLQAFIFCMLTMVFVSMARND